MSSLNKTKEQHIFLAKNCVCAIKKVTRFFSIKIVYMQVEKKNNN